MQKWNIRPAHSVTKSYNLHLVISDLTGLSTAAIPQKQNTHLNVQIEWKGHRRGYLSKRETVRNCTSKQHIQPDGSVTWNEAFEHECNLKVKDPHNFKSWMIHLEVHELGINSNCTSSTIAKVRLNIAKFVCLIDNSEKTIRIPMKCSISGSITEAILTVKFEFYKFQIKGRNSTVQPLSQTSLLPLLSSCIRFQHQTHSNTFQDLNGHPKMVGMKSHANQSRYSSSTESDEEPEFRYWNLAMTNILLIDFTEGKLEYMKNENWDKCKEPNYEVASQSSLIRLPSWKKGRHSFRASDHPRDTPLLNKANQENGGDDIDNERRCQLIPTKPNLHQENNNFQSSRFHGSDRFEVGTWERRKLISRDGQLELVTETFLASIDQRSEKAAGGGACTVLAAVIADWLHQNPKILPLKCQFDKLVHEGSSEWRNLCENEIHRKRFSDQHFDLDTVLKAQLRPLSVSSERSYIGFFVLQNISEHLEFLKGAISFDSIWEEIENVATSEEQIYIVSWNDHFFVMKIEAEVAYIIDTLGERLFEGCNKAYILKFNRESKIYKVQQDSNNQEKGSEESKETDSSTGTEKDNHKTSQDVICEGKSSCKEFIKGFLAALPLRELQTDIERGLLKDAPLHHLLQIEFQYTTPTNKNH